MKLKRRGSNQTVIEYPDGVEVLYSYNTPVAAFVPGRGYVRSSTKYSVTTSKHVNSWVGGRNVGTVISQEELDEIIGRREN
jgi:hypothetical protein